MLFDRWPSCSKSPFILNDEKILPRELWSVLFRMIWRCDGHSIPFLMLIPFLWSSLVVVRSGHHIPRGVKDTSYLTTDKPPVSGINNRVIRSSKHCRCGTSLLLLSSVGSIRLSKLLPNIEICLKSRFYAKMHYRLDMLNVSLGPSKTSIYVRTAIPCLAELPNLLDIRHFSGLTRSL